MLFTHVTPALILFYAFGICWSFLLPGFHSQTPLLSSQKNPESIARNDFDVWLEQQTAIAFDHILDNIGGISSKLDPNEVHKGVVIASPSKLHPNYFYQWVRDAALTIRSLIYKLQDSSFSDLELRDTIENYIANNYHLQRSTNWLGDFDPEANDLSGLGEPKFHPNSTTFDEKWGRPQRDGPGLRVSTIALYLHVLDRYGKEPTNELLASSEFIYREIIKPDLQYIMNNWAKSGFDLWEEIDAIHFFTSITQLRALKDGYTLCQQYEANEFCDKLSGSFEDLKFFITDESGFTQPVSSHIIECPSLFKDGKRAGLDAATFLGVLHSRSLETPELIAQYKDIPFDVDNSYILNSFRAMVTDMKYRYSINRYKPGWGTAIGRYPEDIYDGYGTTEGNPWFICTASLAEVVYKLVYKLNKFEEPIIITKDIREFYSRFLDIYDEEKEDPFIIEYGSEEHRRLSFNLVSYADSFLEVVKDHVDDSGRMSEQFNKYSGYMQGAEDLTWSYSAVWNSIRWRTKVQELLLS